VKTTGKTPAVKRRGCNGRVIDSSCEIGVILVASIRHVDIHVVAGAGDLTTLLRVWAVFR